MKNLWRWLRQDPLWRWLRQKNRIEQLEGRLESAQQEYRQLMGKQISLLARINSLSDGLRVDVIDDSPGAKW